MCAPCHHQHQRHPQQRLLRRQNPPQHHHPVMEVEHDGVEGKEIKGKKERKGGEGGKKGGKKGGRELEVKGKKVIVSYVKRLRVAEAGH